jgi:hypothetical protein
MNRVNKSINGALVYMCKMLGVDEANAAMHIADYFKVNSEKGRCLICNKELTRRLFYERALIEYQQNIIDRMEGRARYNLSADVKYINGRVQAVKLSGHEYAQRRSRFYRLRIRCDDCDNAVSKVNASTLRLKKFLSAMQMASAVQKGLENKSKMEKSETKRKENT